MKRKNQSEKFFKFLTSGILFLVLIFTMNTLKVEASELFFDEDGNLLFHTRDRKYSGNVGYKTLGFVIKRYDMPMDASGQQYVVVQKVSYRPDEPDPEDDRYVLSYFKSDRNEILNAVKSVSSEWFDVLTGYGEDVYIDSVMTVCSQTKDYGTLNKDGTYSGEVYFTYEGIVNARGWTSISVNQLKTHYDMVLEFPQQVKKWEPYIEIISKEDVSVSSSRYASFIMGAGKYGEENYDILEGIPSGEDIYVKGVADSSCGILNLRKVKARLTECVEVPVTYLMQWIDYYGEKKEDTRVIYRYYKVIREFTYYEYVGIDEYSISAVNFYAGLFGSIPVMNVEVPEYQAIHINVTSYGSYKNHMVSYDKAKTPNIGEVLLVGSGGKKPAIPNTDYSSVADEQVSDVRVKNDKVVIENVVILSDEVCTKNGIEPKQSFETSSVDIYKENMTIYKGTPNGKYSDIRIYIVYKNKTQQPLFHNYECGSLTVHTPVYCDFLAYTDKALNQSVQPTSRDVVLGEALTISFDDFGWHRRIKGYGLSSYAKYVGLRQVCCPFKVKYKDKTYEANTWIDIYDYNAKLTVCDDNSEGEYTVYTRTFAYNSEGKVFEEFLEDTANLDIKNYGASKSLNVRLIGKLHNLIVDYGDEHFNAGKLPALIALSGDLDYSLNFEILGDIESGDSVRLNYTYYFEGKDGVLVPVDVYGVKSRNYIDELIAEKFVEEEILADDICNTSDNISKWSVTNKLYEDIIVVPKGTSLDDLKEAIKDNNAEELIYKDGSVIVCVDITSYKGDVAHLSYINEENASKGYCNMWLREGGGSSSYPYGAVVKITMDEEGYYDYEVSGTH